MAQTIKIKRGGIGALASLTGTNAGEIALVTGSAASVGIDNFSVAPRVLLANNGTNWAPVGGAVYTGSGAPGTINAKLNGLLYFDTQNNQFYRLDAGGNQVLDVSATVQNSLIAGGGLLGGSFNGSAEVTFSVDSGSIDINDLGGTPLTVAKGGTGATTLTNGHVLLGAGTSAVTTRAIGIADTNIVRIDHNSVVDNDYAKFTANGLEGRSYSEVKTDLSLDNVENTALSTWPGSSTITTLGTVTAGNVTQILPAGIVSASVLSSPSQGTVRLTTNGVSGGDIDTGLQVSDSPTFADLTLTGGDLIASTATTFNVFNTVATTVNAFGAATTLNIGASTGTATIRNATINLGEEFSDVVNIKGNLNVAGTTTTVNSTVVNIGDKIIELNTANTSGDGGILVREAIGGQTGSLLWDATSNYWKVGVASDNSGGGTLYRLPEQAANSALTENALVNVDANGRLKASAKFTDDGTNGSIADPKFTGLNEGSTANTDRVVFVTNTGVVGQVSATEETTVVTTGLLGYDGTGLTFSSLIDGGTF